MAHIHPESIQTKQKKVSTKIDSDFTFQPLRTVIVSTAHTMHDTYSGFISPLIPLLIERLSLLKVQAGLFLFFYQGLSILQPFIGHTADRRNLRKFALLAPAATGIVISLLGVAPDFFTALVFCAVGGVSSAIMHAILPPFVATLSGDQVGKGMSIWMVGGQLGVLLGPLLITAVVASFSVEATPWLMIGGIIVSILLNILLKDIPYHNELNGGEAAPVPLKALAHIMLPMAAVITMRSFLWSSAEVFLPVYLSESGASLLLTGVSVSIFKGAGLFGTVAGGFLNNRMGFKKVFALSVVASAAAMLLFILTSDIFQMISLTLLGSSSMMILPVGMAVVQSKFPENRSLANGIYLALLFAINALAGVFTGSLYDSFGGYKTFLISALISLFSLPFILLLPKEIQPVLTKRSGEMNYD